MTIDSQTNVLSYSGQFWALAHYFRSIRRGARRFDSQTKAVEPYHAAFVNPDGRHVLVLSNPGAARACQVRLGDRIANVTLETNSIATLEWAVG